MPGGHVNRDFKGVWIPKEIWLDKKLSILEKVLLAEVHSLESPEEGCWASNEYLAKFTGSGLRTVVRALQNLKACGYLVEAGWKNQCRVWRTSAKMALDYGQNGTSTSAKMAHKKSNEKYKRSSEGVHTPNTDEDRKDIQSQLDQFKKEKIEA